MQFDLSKLDRIYSAGTTSVYRGATLDDGTPVILKTLRGGFPARRVVRALRHEHRLLQMVDPEAVVRTHGLFDQDGLLTLCLEDFGGVSLAEACRGRKLTLPAFLDVSIRLAGALAHVHQAGIIHKDISPANVIWNSETQVVKLIDFGISVRANTDEASVDGEQLRGTLAYMSPEQTGRTHRRIDWRSDLYSLGCTLFEALVGRLPFENEDFLELVHAHLATPAPSAHDIDPNVPEALSRILLKLLEKDAESRYQSAYGVKADLERVRDTIARDGECPPFELGTQDTQYIFRIPDRLYGRDREVQWLLERFEEAASGPAGFCVVGGYSGIGKTALIRTVQPSIVERRGTFLSGKFDQFKRGIPYASLIEAFERFTHQILSLSGDASDAWRDRILEATAPNAQLLIDVIPDLRHLLGEQPAVPELPPNEAENRLNVAFGRFVRALARPEQPFILFLDDLQWADLPSLRVIERLVTDARAENLLVLGAYRDNEVGPAHPLAALLARLAEAGRPAGQIILGPLTARDTRTLIADAQRTTPEAIAELADLCMEKTQGNPFFLNQFLSGLHEAELVRFDLREGAWTWQLDEIRARGITDNVVEFMTAKLEQLPVAPREVLTVGAVLGSTVDLALLTKLLSHEDEEQTVEALEHAAGEGLVYLEPGEELRARFLHDRVQQAAYEMLDEDRRLATHLHVGRLLRDAHATEGEASIFDALNHLNAASDLITDPQERIELAQLNREASGQARRASAYLSAQRFAHAGQALMPAGAFANHYRLAMDLHLEAAEASFLVGDYDEMDRTVEAVLANAQDTLDAVGAHEIRVNARNAQNDLTGAVQSNLDALALLGVELPLQPSQASVLAQLVRTKLALRGKDTGAVARLPEMTDPQASTAVRLMMNVIGAAYYASPNLLPLVAFYSVRLTLDKGVIAESATAFSLYGLVLCTLDDMDGAYAYGQVATAIADRFDGHRHASRARHLYNTHVRFWKEPWINSLEPLRRSHEHAYSNGDFEYAAFSGFMRASLMGASGLHLAEVIEEMERMAAALDEMQQGTSGFTLALTRQAALNVRGDTDGEPWQLKGESYDEDVLVAQHREAGDSTNLYCYYTIRMRLAYLFGNLELALQSAADAGPEAASTFFVVDAIFYETLTRLQIGPSLGPIARAKNAARLLKVERRLRKYAAFCPENLGCRVALVDAEKHRLAGRYGDAIEAYDRSATGARRGGWTHLEALALERAGRMQQARDNEPLATAYLKAARVAYERWGAFRKSQALTKEFPFIAGSVGGVMRARTITDTGEGASDALDMQSVVRASLAISEEIRLDSLLERMMHTVAENAGAQSGVLVWGAGDDAKVQASLMMKGGKPVVRTQLGTTITEHPGVSEGIVRVALRTGSAVVLDDAARSGDYTQDAYVLARRPKSVLCAPLAHQGVVRGALYLENNLTRGAFTHERLQTLQLLAAQAAISIENAELYENLEAKVQERTRQLELRNEFIRKTFGRYLSDDVVDSILDEPQGLALGGELRRLSVVMADLRGFSSAASALPPQQVLLVVNNFLSVMTDVILQYEGTIDEVLGDGLLVLFGAPIQRADDADRAVACALAMQHAMTRVNERNVEMGLPVLEMGIGIHTGEGVVGNIGSDKRAKYGVVGTVVNMAARIEGLTTGGQVLISDDTKGDMVVSTTVIGKRTFEPKGAPAPITVHDVRGVGAPYDLALATEDAPMRDVEAFQIECAQVSDVASSEAQHGRVIRLSRNAMVVESPARWTPFTNVRVAFPEAPDARVYAKIVEANGPGSFLVRFTALPDAARAAVDARLANA